MNAKAIGVIIAFTALTTGLNFVRIPAPYNIVLSYQLSDVVLIVAFLLFGIKVGLTIAGLNMILKMFVFVDVSGPIGPPYYLVAFLSMFFGMYLFEKLVKQQKLDNHRISKDVTISTFLGTFTRTLIMLPLDYLFFGSLVSVVAGLTLSEAYAVVIAAMPTLIFYNITVPIIMIPTSYFIAKKISRHTSTLFRSPFINQQILQP